MKIRRTGPESANRFTKNRTVLQSWGTKTRPITATTKALYPGLATKCDGLEAPTSRPNLPLPSERRTRKHCAHDHGPGPSASPTQTVGVFVPPCVVVACSSMTSERLGGGGGGAVSSSRRAATYKHQRARVNMF